ncbi:portal protein [Breoghania sp. JC706]|uniref:portal protein n=1 Tax=Breoghania sp. JC706 TaxID=3117732 RepID=UPI00300A5833
MGVVSDLKQELSAAETDRLGYETDWRDYVDFAAPDMERQFNTARGVTLTGVQAWKRSAAKERSRKIYDSTAVYLLDRFAAGIEALTMPRNYNWHGVTFADIFAPEPGVVEEQYFDRLRDYLFRCRSDRSGFPLSNRSVLKSVCKLGTGVMYIDENRENVGSAQMPMHYRYVPLYEIYLIIDAQGNDVGFFRKRDLAAWQIAREYGGDKVSDRVKADANAPSRRGNRHVVVQACFLREGGMDNADSIRRSRFESVHFEHNTGHILRTGGFFAFPLAVRRWDRDGLSPYGSPPQARLMGDIKSLQVLCKEDLIAASNVNRPALATSGEIEDGVDLNHGAINPGLISADGKRLYAPMVDVANPGAANPRIQDLRENLRLGLYGDLWQTLLEGNGRTATEVQVRAQEKADQLGPFSVNVQAGNVQLFDREFDIIGRRGAFAPGAALEPPESVAQYDVTVSSTAPIDKMREAGAFQDIMAFREYLGAAAQTTPEVVQIVDPFEEAREVRKSLGLGMKGVRSDEELQQIREQNAAEQEQMQQMQAAQGMAQVAKDAAPMAKLVADQANGGGDVGQP